MSRMSYSLLRVAQLQQQRHDHVREPSRFTALVPFVLFVTLMCLGIPSQAQDPFGSGTPEADASKTPSDAAGAENDEESIPGETEPLSFDFNPAPSVSPNGRYVAVHIDRETVSRVDLKSKEFDYQAFGYIYVLDRETLTAVLLDPYSRSVSVLWSPEGSHLAFNDEEGSDCILCYVYSFYVENGKLAYRKTDVSESFMKLDRANELRRMIHQYISAKRWSDENTLIVGVSGHAAPDGREPDWIEWYFQFDLKTETFIDVTAAESPHLRR